MSFICDDCQYIFSQKRSSCPFCGGRVYNNNTPESTLLINGYSWAPTPNAKNQNTDVVASNKYFEDLRQSFFKQHESQKQPSAIPEITPRVIPSQNNPRPADTPVSETDYFSQFRDSTNGTDDIPVVKPTTLQTNPVLPQEQDLYSQELQELERQRQRLRSQYRRRAFFNSIMNIRWRALFRLLLVVIVIAAVIFVWNMRHIIFSSIINFLFSLVPTILVIWLLWQLIRAFFQ